MIVYAVYVIDKDGTMLVSETFQAVDEIQNDILLGGLITALQHVATEIHRSEMKTLEIEGLSYHIRSFGLCRVVVVTNVPKTPENIIQALGLRFMKEYGEMLLDHIYIQERFDPFKGTIHEVVKKATVTDESKLIKPEKKLNTGEIFSFPHNLQATALAMLSLQEGTVEEIAQESGTPLKATKKNLDELNERGFLGIKQQNGKTMYFCAI